LRTRFSVYLIAFLLIFCLPFPTSAGELPRGPAMPALALIPSLPSVHVFGTPKPPGISGNMPANMPDMDFWKEKSLAWPLRGIIVSGFGLRYDGESVRVHEGIDIPAPTGAPIQSAGAGVVAEARTYRGYGYTVIVDHKNGIKTLYAHCSSLAVKKGEQVEDGQVIAYVGSTGRATSSHLHFGVMVQGAFKDPMVYLKDRSQQFVSKP